MLVTGTGPILKIMKTIKTIAHLILAQLETLFIGRLLVFEMAATSCFSLKPAINCC